MAKKTTRRTSPSVSRTATTVDAGPDSAGLNLGTVPSGNSNGRANWQFDLNAATKAGANLAIVRVRLLEVHGATSNRAFSELPAEVQAEIALTEPRVTTKNNLVSIVTEFSYSLKSGTPESPTPVADVRALTELLYSQKPESDLSPDELAAFATVNAPFNAWPYWRELTQSILTRLGLPALPLPLFRISDLPGLLRKV
jgi:hypothetical protein